MTIALNNDGDVRYWHLADIDICADVSALRGKADAQMRVLDV
jgi:hypothetical protein